MIKKSISFRVFPKVQGRSRLLNFSNVFDGSYSLSSAYQGWGRRAVTLVTYGKPNHRLDEGIENGDQNECFLLVATLKACTKMKDFIKGTIIHADIAKRGLLKKNPYLATALITMYSRCGLLTKAHELLEELPFRNVVSWNALITGYAHQGQSHEALDCFEWMQNEGVAPDAVTFTCALKACGKTGDLGKGKQIHKEIVRRGLLGGKDVVLCTALVDMYAKCGVLGKAQELLQEFPIRDVVSWSALIAGYARRGKGEEALDCLSKMQREGLSPNAVTFICILRACASSGALGKGESAHDEILSRGLLKNNIVLGTVLINMYARCGQLAKAQQVLKELPSRNEVSWNALISGYAEHGQCQNAVKCFYQMQKEGISPNVVTFICILNVCTKTGAIGIGAKVHEEIVKQCLFNKDIALGNALVDMYAKCGFLAKAKQVLEEILVRDVISWSTLIAGYAQQGKGREALVCLTQMEIEGLSPNLVTFTCVLSACCHSGLVGEAEIVFENMTRKFSIDPNLRHQTCMVVVYGYAGNFDKAMSVIELMSPNEYPAAWLVLLGACRKWGNLRLGLLSFDQAVQLDTSCAAAYVLMANIFTAAGMKKDAENVEAMREKYAT